MVFAIKRSADDKYIKNEQLEITDNLDDAMVFNSFDLAKVFFTNNLSIKEYSILRIIDRS